VSNQVVTRTGYFGRLGKSIQGVFIGAILVLVAIGLLWWNEGRAVDTAKGLAEGRDVVVEVDGASLDPGNDGALVHVQGETVAGTPVVDDHFGLETEALSIVRTVEMFQWVEDSRAETRERIGGGEETVTTYSYTQQWKRGVVDSSRFNQPGGHQNPGTLPYESKSTYAADATLGDFTLSSEVIARLPRQSLAPTAYDEERIDNSQVFGEYVYVGANPSQPAIGDIRVSFEVIEPGTASVIAAQRGSTFAPWTTSRGTDILLVAAGRESVDEMFTAAEAANKQLTWLLRLLGLVVMTVAFTMLLGPL
jgi:hypothetical protein